MTAMALERLWKYRLANLGLMQAAPGKYKECDQCRAIGPRQWRVCKLCGAYRFHEDPEVILKTVAEMATRPMPLSAGVVPRISPEQWRSVHLTCPPPIELSLVGKAPV
jgi:hypothetical protein